jgi:hypothetical protein
MNAFILAWVLMNMNGYGAVSYSPPVKTVEDCQRLQKFLLERGVNAQRSQCIQINVLARGKE